MNLDLIPEKNKDILFRKEKNKVIMLDELSGAPYLLEDTGSFIWLQIDGKKNLNRILEILFNSFEGDEKQISNEFIEFITTLKENNLIRFKNEA